MHECPKTHFKHKCMHASHHATLSCHVTMQRHHAMSSYHIIMPFSMPCQHATSSCHVSMPNHHAISTCYVIMPHHHAMSCCLYHMDATCHLFSGAMSSCLYSTDATCHPVNDATWHLFLPNLPVDLIEQNTMTFSYRVGLRWNEHRWNHLDEPFDMVLVLLRLEDFKKFSFLDPPGSISALGEEK